MTSHPVSRHQTAFHPMHGIADALRRFAGSHTPNSAEPEPPSNESVSGSGRISTIDAMALVMQDGVVGG
jgi:hypothetical protein